ncbi:Cyclin, N-terminal domain [Rhizoctonia solani]|uniref:Cyclin, N-terminal domain n=1 Tax=Rhizoctonia solani TaxID=456999 RepID=A0A8H7M7Y2_9AGAM|nr:Cyclin, N-terminal domain [Rhizoctonia solani]KAF8759923.1 Cyclin, N-terminal domain [Rhizoctonia solani]
MSGLQQWYFSPIDMLKTPSTVHGCTLEEELSARQKGVELLLRVAGQLRLPVNAFVAAAAYFHRFYMRNSIKDYNYRDIAATCIFLATKVEECGRKLKDVATTVIFKTNASLKPDTDIQVLENSKVCTVSCGGVPRWSYLSKEHKKWTENILVYEETLLDSLCFDLVVESPHACLATAFNSAAVGTGQHEIFQVMDIAFPQDSAPEEQQVLDSVVLNAWGIAHDTARIIAASCFMISLVSCSNLSTEWTDFPSPFDRYLSADPSMLVWLEKFSLRSSDIQQISDCIFIMLCFYKTSEPNERIQSPIPYQQLVPPTLAAVQWPPTSTPASSQPTHEQTNVG